MDRNAEGKIHPSPTPAVEKRSRIRRLIKDRRAEVRFEPKKENRRQNKGRRSSDIELWSD